ncbi:MAG TPA: hypothetical protein VM008_21710 [Phycisphaerae bacterium]|nr:hypothetical protein [Phycisphaerae bacterium]
MEPAFYRILFRSALASLILIAFTAAALLGTLYSWRFAREHLQHRTLSLTAGIAGGLLAAFLLTLAMRALDKPMRRHCPPWYLRWPLKINKRIILLVQLAAAGLAVASAYFLLFNFKIPAL